MIALQKKQSLLFIRCWLIQALQQGRKVRISLLLHPPSPQCPQESLTCRTCGHRVGTQQKWDEHNRWGRGLPRWWAAGSRVQGVTLDGQMSVHTVLPCVLGCISSGYGSTHQGGSCCLSRRSCQMFKQLFHLGQFLSTDVICVWKEEFVIGIRPSVLGQMSSWEFAFPGILSQTLFPDPQPTHSSAGRSASGQELVRQHQEPGALAAPGDSR